MVNVGPHGEYFLVKFAVRQSVVTGIAQGHPVDIALVILVIDFLTDLSVTVDEACTGLHTRGEEFFILPGGIVDGD